MQDGEDRDILKLPNEFFFSLTSRAGFVEHSTASSRFPTFNVMDDRETQLYGGPGAVLWDIVRSQLNAVGDLDYQLEVRIQVSKCYRN